MDGETPFTIPFGPTHWCQPVITLHHMNSSQVGTFWDFERTFYRAQGFGDTRPMLIRDIYNEYFQARMQTRRGGWDNFSEDRFYIDPNLSPKLNSSGSTSTSGSCSGNNSGSTSSSNSNSSNNSSNNSSHSSRSIGNIADWAAQRTKNPKKYNWFERRAHLSAYHCEKACESLPEKECFQWRFSDGVCAIGFSFKIGEPFLARSSEEEEMVSGWVVGRIRTWILKRGNCERVRWPGLALYGQRKLIQT